MSSNQVMAQGFMDSGYGGCLLMHRAYFLWLLPERPLSLYRRGGQSPYIDRSD